MLFFTNFTIDSTKYYYCIMGKKWPIAETKPEKGSIFLGIFCFNAESIALCYKYGEISQLALQSIFV